MIPSSARELYDEAWHELFDLVESRNKLLRSLGMMSNLAMEVTPAAGMVIEFDVSRAEELVAGVDELTHRISAGIQRVNSYAEKCGAPSLKWQNISLRTEE
jgi:hypothetical protein